MAVSASVFAAASICLTCFPSARLPLPAGHSNTRRPPGRFHYLWTGSNHSARSFSIMFELLHQAISEKISVTDEEFSICTSLFTAKKLRRRQYLLQEGDICKYTAFISRGILRSYTVDEKGGEHILQFALEGWWAADLYSFLTDEPSLFNMEALEDTELLLITRPSWDILLQKVPKFERYFRILVQNNLIATQRRLLQSMSETAEAKYLKFIKTYPESIQRIPQHMIASYLGITRETLSRLRKEIVAGKKRP